MNPRVLKAAGALAIPVVVVVCYSTWASGRLAGQAPSSGAGTETAEAGAKRTTPWGEPDLQGIWTNDYQIPLQRPARYANKEFFTDEEIAELDRIRGKSHRLGDRVAPRGSEADVNGAYNSVFTSQKHTGRRTSLIIDPPDGRIPPAAPEAKKRREEVVAFENATMQATEACKKQMPGCAGGKYGLPSPRRLETPPHYLANPSRAGGGGAINRADGPEDRNLEERCMGSSLPMLAGFMRVVQSPRFVSIFYDVGQGQGWQRVVPITSAPHLPSHVRQWRGDSRGRWEGETLIVDVTNFTPKRDYQGSRENTHLVERFTRIDEKTLEYVATLEDPTAWMRPWTLKQEFARQAEQPNRVYYEPRCHEGNIGMAGLLAGARADDKAFAEGRGPDPATLCGGGCGLGIEDENADPLSR